MDSSCVLSKSLSCSSYQLTWLFATTVDMNRQRPWAERCTGGLLLRLHPRPFWLPQKSAPIKGSKWKGGQSRLWIPYLTNINFLEIHFESFHKKTGCFRNNFLGCFKFLFHQLCNISWYNHNTSYNSKQVGEPGGLLASLQLRRWEQQCAHHLEAAGLPCRGPIQYIHHAKRRGLLHPTSQASEGQLRELLPFSEKSE